MKRFAAVVLAFLVVLGVFPASAVHVHGAEITEPIVDELSASAESMLAGSTQIGQDAEVVKSGTCGENITWALNNAGVLTISGEGDMPDFFMERAPWQGGIKKVVIEEGVTSIGANAFNAGYGIMLVELPESLRLIGSSAFRACYDLMEIKLPAGLQEIEHSAFEACWSLKKIEVPAGVKTLEEETFFDCKALEEVILHEGLTTICKNAFLDTKVSNLILPDSVTTLEYRALGGCKDKTITLPAQLTTLGEHVFFGAVNLEEIIFQGNPPAFHTSAFWGMTGFARYPADNPAWTPEVMQRYGGDVAWVDYNHVHNLVEVTVDPMCGVEGYTASQCTLCGGKINVEIIAALFHSLVDATCTEPMRCVREGCTYTSGEPLGHRWEDPYVTPLVCVNCGITDTHLHDYNKIVTAPTCTAPGYTTFVCNTCQYTYVGDNTEATGHTPGEPNCTTGTLCVYCGEALEAPLPHVFKTDWSQGDVTGHWYDCENCENHSDSVSHIPNVAFATNETAKYCTVCGFVIEEQLDYDEVTVVAKGLWDGGPVKWKVTSDGVLTISGNRSVQPKSEYIWKEYSDIIRRVVLEDGITNVPSEAFSGMKNIRSVYLGNRVTKIEENAFSGCENLNEVTIPKSITQIESHAFYNCNNLTSVLFENGSKLESIGMNAFCNSGITSLTTPESLRIIKGHAFQNCTSLQEINLSNGLEEIMYYAFSGCTDLKRIYLPESLKSVGGYVFNDCYALEKVENYSSATLGGFGNRKALKTVIWSGNAGYIGTSCFKDCTALTDVFLGENVSAVGGYAFSGCSSLTNINLPEKLKKIETKSLEKTGLAILVIPKSVTEIEMRAFSGSPIEKIIFLADAPSFSMSAFDSISATVSYYGNHPTWTEDKLQSYGGNITWVNMDQHDHVFETVTVEATCYNPGYTTYNCSCGHSYVGDHVDTLEHEYESVTVEVTYLEPGYKKHTCTRCGYTYRENETPALGLPKPVVKTSNNTLTGEINLAWEYDGAADYYEVYYATSSKGKYKLMTTVVAPESSAGFPVGKTYYFKVKAICESDKTLSSGYSAVVKAAAKCSQPQVSVENNASSGKPVLKWGKFTGAKKYTVYRVDENGKRTTLATTTKTSYTDSKATAGKTYTYCVRANASQSSYNSAYSENISCTAICAQPALTVKIDAATGKAALSWKKITGAASYDIFRATAADGEFEKIANQTELTYKDTDAAADTDYWYKVQAIAAKEEMNSGLSAAKKIHTTLAKPVVTFAIDDATGKPILTWEEVEGATEYKVYRSSKSTSSYKAVKTTTDLSYIDTSVGVAKGYYYKVIAVNENVKSAYSAYKKLTAKCAQPVVTLDVNDNGQPVLKWEKIAGAKKYTIYRTDESGEEVSLGTTTKLTYTDKKAAEGATYTYRVRANGSKSTYNGVHSEPVIFGAYGME